MTNSRATHFGTLYIVATPIGNLDDISLRALKVLKSVDLILAEDTRHSQQLLTALGIKNRLSSYHAHNEAHKTQAIIEQLQLGQSIALISDAGTPLISDPGFLLVRQSQQNQIPVVPIPGACALITALSASGVPCDSFLFLGFLPAKSLARKNILQSLLLLPHTLIFYESTHRIKECLHDIDEIFGNHTEIVLAKELTKSYERIISGTVTEVLKWLSVDENHIKGEFVLIIPPRSISIEHQADEELLQVLLQELPLKQAVSIACKLSKANKNELYELALKLKNSK